jgi:hypothetical protein
MKAMDASKVRYDTAYLRVLAGAYLLLCGACSLYYAGLDLGVLGDAAQIPPPWHVQILCLLAALSAAVYFVRPRAGLYGLIAVTLATLLAAGTGMSPRGVVFHLAVLVLLCLPLLSVFASLRGSRHCNTDD